MVTSVINGETKSTIAKKLPLVVELVGPAGAGKTTISDALRQCRQRIIARNFPFVRGAGDAPFFIRHGLLLAPTFVRLSKNRNNSRRLTRREIAWMVILNGWHHLLKRRRSHEGKIVVLDQGSIFLLVELHVFGPDSLRSRSLNSWWEGIYRKWAATLDMVVYLDTSDKHLVDRIHRRNQWHLMKGKPEPEILEFVARYRMAYEKVLTKLEAISIGLRILRFDTAQESSDGIVKELLFEFGLANDV